MKVFLFLLLLKKLRRFYLSLFTYLKVELRSDLQPFSINFLSKMLIFYQIKNTLGFIQTQGDFQPWNNYIYLSMLNNNLLQYVW